MAGQPLALETAERISGALTELAAPDLRGAAKAGLRQAVASGFLEVRLEGHEMVCRYDPAVADPAAWDRALRARLGDDDADRVRYVPVTASPAVLAGLAEAVTRREWMGGGPAFKVGVHVDWQQERVEVTVGQEATPEQLAALRDLLGEDDVVHEGTHMWRRGGRGA